MERAGPRRLVEWRSDGGETATAELCRVAGDDDSFRVDVLE